MNKRGRKIAADTLFVLCFFVFMGMLLKLEPWRKNSPVGWGWTALGVFLTVCFLIVCVDLYRLCKKLGDIPEKEPKPIWMERLILLDEQDKPVKSWDLAGKTALVIGKAGSEDVDIDLADCEYSSFIDYQHAVLNFCLDRWYLEDFGSSNGVWVRKVEDGQRYKVMGRPCRLTPGDVLYIANTRLLLS